MALDVADWLRGRGLEQYASAFRDNAIDAELLPSLTAEDLRGTVARPPSGRPDSSLTSRRSVTRTGR
jgi:hypothetical protein